MATNPLKTYKDIDNILNKLIKSKADSVIGVTELEDHHPLRIKRIVKGKIKNFNSSLKEIPETHRQQLRPKAYIRNGSVYAAKRNLILKKKRYGTVNSLAYIMESEKSINIDTPIDLELCKLIMKKMIFSSAIIGTGYGLRVLSKCLLSIKNINLNYIFSRSKKGLYFTNNIHVINKDKKINLICIETPPYTHLKYINFFIKKNSYILCEKPVVNNIQI